jgi:hypothetical protein
VDGREAGFVVSSMSARTSKATLIYAVALVLLFAGNEANAQQQHSARKRPPKQQIPDPPPPPPAPPPPPPTLEQLPAVPPKVTFSNGLLTIVAENSTLADILRAVRVKTGAVVEVPPNATERVVAHLGPGPARSVLASLLNGSHFNYVMLGSPTNPDKVDRVILTSKSGGTPDAGTPLPAPAAAQEGNIATPEDEPDAPQADIAERPVDDAGENSAQDNQPQQPNGQPPIKTPEQLLRELQQQQLQQQQQQQQPAQNPPPQ